MIAVVIDNIYALLTLASIYAKMPDVDPYVIYVGKAIPEVEQYLRGHNHDKDRTGVIPSYEMRTVHIALRAMTHNQGYMLALRGGLIVVQDPRPYYPSAERMEPYSTGISRKYMYVRHTVHHKSYRALGINIKDNRSTRTTYHRLDVPFSNERYLTLTPSFYFADDPLLGGFMNGREVLKHARQADESYVVDFINLATSPRLKVLQAYGAPLELYAQYAEDVANLLPADTLAVIRKNGQRSRLVAPARKLTLPLLPLKGVPSHETGRS